MLGKKTGSGHNGYAAIARTIRCVPKTPRDGRKLDTSRGIPPAQKPNVSHPRPAGA